eukprot:1601241-Amphidinium_carterae.3
MSCPLLPSTPQLRLFPLHIHDVHDVVCSFISSSTHKPSVLHDVACNCLAEAVTSLDLLLSTRHKLHDRDCHLFPAQVTASASEEEGWEGDHSHKEFSNRMKV